MENPFQNICERLGNIEKFLLQLDDRLNLPTSTPAASKFLDVSQAADFLHVKKQTIYQNIDKIPHLKKHGKLLFVEADLRAYLTESEVQNG